MNYFKIKPEELRDLLINTARLQCLEANGVDNWFGYMDNRETYIADVLDMSLDEIKENDLQFSDVADKWLQNYELIEEED